MSKAAGGRGSDGAAEAVPTLRLEAPAIRRGLTAALLAWAVPGLGHWYAGARQRALVFLFLVVLATGLGIVFDGNLAVADSRVPWISRLQVASGLALGPAEPVIRQSLYGALVYNGDDGFRYVAPAAQAALAKRRERSFATWSAYGTAYLMAAGLMNLLLILDAWDIGIGRKKRD